MAIVRVLATVVLWTGAGVAALTTLPASAHAATFQIVNAEDSSCLEVHVSGDAFLAPCLAINANQLWERWDGGWTRNVGTGHCLRADGRFSPASIYAAACGWDEPRMHWLHWQGGWYQRAEFVENAVTNPAECLSRVPGSADVTGVICDQPLGPNPPAELWRTVEVAPSAPPSPPPAPDTCERSAAVSRLQLRVRFRGSGPVLTTRYGRRPHVVGTLRAPDGSPVPGASLCVGVQKSARMPVRAVGTVVSDDRGRIAYRLDRGSSRRIWFVHQDGGVSTAATVRLRVRAPLVLRASSRSLRNGQALVLRGRLLAGIRRRGLLVELQAARTQGWVTFATTRTRRKGRFRYVYRFTRTVGVAHYRIRARIPAQLGSSFAPGSSQRVRVRVVG